MEESLSFSPILLPLPCNIDQSCPFDLGQLINCNRDERPLIYVSLRLPRNIEQFIGVTLRYFNAQSTYMYIHTQVPSFFWDYKSDAYAVMGSIPARGSMHLGCLVAMDGSQFSQN